MKRRDRYNATSYLLADEARAARSEQLEQAIGTAFAVATMPLPAHARRRDYRAMFAATNRMLKLQDELARLNCLYPKLCQPGRSDRHVRTCTGEGRIEPTASGKGRPLSAVRKRYSDGH
jgi:hypothetical protein